MSEDNNYFKPPHKNIWWYWLGIIGVVLLISGSSQANTFQKIIYGLGISFLTLPIFKIVGSHLENFSKTRWLEHHVEIVTNRRKDAEEKYEKENSKAKDRIRIVSFSAGAAFEDLKNKGSLYKALTRGVNVEILIVNPKSEFTKQRTNEDKENSSGKGQEGIVSNFSKLKGVYEAVRNSLVTSSSSKHNFGRLEVRVTDSNPYLTLYIRDDTVIFGHYLSHGRGDEKAAMRLKSKWNEEVFRQFDEHFTTLWAKAGKKKQLFWIVSDGNKCKFNEKLFSMLS